MHKGQLFVLLYLPDDRMWHLWLGMGRRLTLDWDCLQRRSPSGRPGVQAGAMCEPHLPMPQDKKGGRELGGELLAGAVALGTQPGCNHANGNQPTPLLPPASYPVPALLLANSILRGYQGQPVCSTPRTGSRPSQLTKPWRNGHKCQQISLILL